MSFPSAQIYLLISLVVESHIPFAVSLLPQAVVSIPPLFLFSCQHPLGKYLSAFLCFLPSLDFSFALCLFVSVETRLCRSFLLPTFPLEVFPLPVGFALWFSPLPLRISQPFFSPSLRRASFSCVSLAASIDLRFSTAALPFCFSRAPCPSPRPV